MARESERKIIKVEGNFIELFPVRFVRRKSRAEEFTQTITKPRGTAVIRHSSRFFTAFDMDVMVAAFELSYRQGQRCFPATLSDFARMMKITNCGENLNAIRESLVELSATTATFNDIWYDCKLRTYKSETALSFIAYKLVRRNEIVGGKLRPEEVRNLSWVEIPKYFYDSIANGYFKYIDTDVYFSLPSGLSRAAFLYLEKRMGVKNHYEEKTASALENIIKRPPKHQDIKDFNRRTLPRLSGVFNFDKKKLKKGMIDVSRRVLFYGAAAETAGATEKVAEAEKAETAEVTGVAEALEKASAAATAGDFTPRAAAGGSTDLPRNGVATLSRNTPRPFGPPRRKLTSHEEYVLERACILCNRDDDYFKNVVRKYIFLRGADPVAAAISDTRDARPESTSRYLIHLLKNL